MHLPPFRIPFRRPSKGGFTLVEVVISLGLVSFALVSMVGMLPVGLETQRKATTNLVESQIVQGIASDILSSDFNNLASQILKYDHEGKLLPASGNESDMLYKVSVDVQDSSLPVNLKTAQNEAYNVVISVENRTRPNDPGRYSFVVARTAL